MTYYSSFAIAQPIMKKILLFSVVMDTVNSLRCKKLIVYNTAIAAVSAVALGAVAITFGPEVAANALFAAGVAKFLFTIGDLSLHAYNRYGKENDQNKCCQIPEKRALDQIAINLFCISLGVLMSLEN